MTIDFFSSSDDARFMDDLYPVVHSMVNPNAEIRNMARYCLQTITQVCNYASMADLLVDNADYLVNGVGIRLHTFEFTANTPLVLTVLIHLCGPKIVPYLDDIVQSIFSGLDNYHGYHRLTASFFEVLSAICDITATLGDVNVNYRRFLWKPITTEDAGVILERIKNPRPIPDFEDESAAFSNQQKVIKTSLVNSQTIKIVTKIVTICQYYLTHESALLRSRILQLLTQSWPVIFENEDAMVHINRIWQPLVARLSDDESMVLLAAWKCIAFLCQLSADDSMSSRVRKDVWPRMREWWLSLYPNLKTTKQVSIMISRDMEGEFFKAFLQILESTWVDDETFDEILELFKHRLNPQLQEALNKINPDAVWLVLNKKVDIHAPASTDLADIKFNSKILSVSVN